jgi:hypothetical protein
MESNGSVVANLNAADQSKESIDGCCVFYPTVKTETTGYYRVRISSNLPSFFVHSSDEPQNSIAMDCAVGAKNLQGK